MGVKDGKMKQDKNMVSPPIEKQQDKDYQGIVSPKNVTPKDIFSQPTNNSTQKLNDSKGI